MSLKIVTISDGFGSATVPSIVDPVAGVVKHITLTNTDITNGYAMLDTAPSDPQSSVLSWQGLVQVYTLDYTLSGSQVNFNSNLLTKLESGDVLTLYYQ
jgi:PBP1b-binding outer membrane lipoprotein LpoB